VENWILGLAASPLVYLGMYLFATIDGFFPPIPSESLAIALAALSVASGKPNLELIILVAAAGAFTGDQIAYVIGKRVDTLRIPLLKGPPGQRTLDWAERTLAHQGASFILAARFIPVGRVAVNMTAGAMGYSRRRFVLLAAIASVSWSLYSAVIGIGAGAWFKGHPLGAIAVGVVSGLLIGLALDRALRHLAYRQNRTAGSGDPAAIQTGSAEGLTRRVRRKS
jgi:membrane-associated protein